MLTFVAILILTQFLIAMSFYFLDTSLISLLEQQLESSRRDSETLLNRPTTGVTNPTSHKKKENILEKENRTIDHNIAEEQNSELFLQF